MPEPLASGMPAWPGGPRHRRQRRPTPLRGGRRGPARPAAPRVSRNISRLAKADPCPGETLSGRRAGARATNRTAIAAYRTSVVAKDIVGLIRAFGPDRAHVVGHDWGGGIAWALATLRPEAVGRLVVLNCPHPAIMQKALRSNWAQIRKSWYIFAFQLPWVPEWSFRRNGAKGLKDALRRTAAEHTINYCGQARSALPKQQTAGPLGPRTITAPPPDRACRMERSRRPRCSSGPKTISPSGSSSREGWTASSTIRLASNTYPTRATG
jgi:pimeloyl-ACP methyl ester carboxylesterase